MFTNQPQVVEVYRSGTWWPGELLGWRHDELGACQVQVRMTVRGLAETGWTELAALRLPEVPVAAPVEQQAPARPASRAVWRAVADVETTASLPLARDHAVTEVAHPRSGGRRRAPDDVVVRRASASSVPVPVPGRHRAASADPDAGRHRAADTELFSAIVDEPAPSSRQRRDDLLATATWSMPVARPVPAAETIADEPSSRRGSAEELLTRPMRLSDQTPQSRRPRLMAH